jgi:hypothetical protein
MTKPVVAVPSRGLRPRTPSSAGSLALARPTGDVLSPEPRS